MEHSCLLLPTIFPLSTASIISDFLKKGIFLQQQRMSIFCYWKQLSSSESPQDKSQHVGSFGVKGIKDGNRQETLTKPLRHQMLWLLYRWVRKEHRDAAVKLWPFLCQQAMDAKSLHRFKKKAGGRQSYPIPLKSMSHLCTGDCGVREQPGRLSAHTTLSYPAFLHLLQHLLLPQWNRLQGLFWGRSVILKY